MKRRISVYLIIVLFFGGLALFAYPLLNGLRLESEAASAVEVFQQAAIQAAPAPSSASPMPTPYNELLQAMRDYNEEIYLNGQSGLSDPWSYEAVSIDISQYGIADGVIAVLTIPKLELEMPVYLGASYDNMAAGAAHLTETSLPIGGNNTNCVIAGHRGWNGAPYFLHLDQLEVGDKLSVTNLWETLDYVVAEIKIIEPYEVDAILIQPGRELLTLMTCHPPNTGGRYRLLVVCERGSP